MTGFLYFISFWIDIYLLLTVEKTSKMSEKKPFTLEFVFRASPHILFNFITTPSGLTQWFADEVHIDKEVYTFGWSGTEEKAEVVEKHEPDLVRFRWEGAPEDEYFEFRIKKSEVTGDTILFLTDFAEDFDVEDQKDLWQNQIDELQKRVGG